MGASSVKHAALFTNSARLLRLLAIIALIRRLLSFALVWSVTLNMV